MVVLEEELAEDDEVYDNGELIRRKNRYKQLTQRVKSKGKQLPWPNKPFPGPHNAPKSSFVGYVTTVGFKLPGGRLRTL